MVRTVEGLCPCLWKEASFWLERMMSIHAKTKNKVKKWGRHRNKCMHSVSMCVLSPVRSVVTTWTVALHVLCL